ncbi:transposase [Paucisalibacillus sp. EB02]|uniref:transposase n=1 Tax=Paucisalibacillus sp. EB02 TaxID=1347087 RepID=UPI0004B32496|nr:transposase [Paucisalibacillus sp. EB02]
MPRERRREGYTGVYHVILRGINRQTIFEDDEDRLRLLETLERYKKVSKFRLFCYCLMDNHIHLLVQEKEESISKAIQRISASYVYWYNAKYDRVGHLFQGRYRRESVDTYKYFQSVLRYIHQNPLKAKIVSNVFDYRWTSIHEYINRPKLVDVHHVLRMFSSDSHKAIKTFIQFIQEPNDDICLDDDVNVKYSDDDVREFLTRIGIPNSSAIQQMNKDKRNIVLLQLKEIEGISIRQLARITGISKSVIDRIR